MAKTYVPQLRNVIVWLCAYITRHRVKIEATIVANIPAGAKRDTVLTCLDAIIAACAVLEEYFPDIP